MRTCVAGDWRGRMRESKPYPIEMERQEKHISVLIIFKELPLASRSKTPCYNSIQRGTLWVCTSNTNLMHVNNLRATVEPELKKKKFIYSFIYFPLSTESGFSFSYELRTHLQEKLPLTPLMLPGSAFWSYPTWILTRPATNKKSSISAYSSWHSGQTSTIDVAAASFP